MVARGIAVQKGKGKTLVMIRLKKHRYLKHNFELS